MAKKRSKRYRLAAEMFEEDKNYTLTEAIDILKKKLNQLTKKKY